MSAVLPAQQEAPVAHSLFAYPLESNFSGARYAPAISTYVQTHGVASPKTQGSHGPEDCSANSSQPGSLKSSKNEGGPSTGRKLGRMPRDCPSTVDSRYTHLWDQDSFSRLVSNAKMNQQACL